MLLNKLLAPFTIPPSPSNEDPPDDAGAGGAPELPENHIKSTSIINILKSLSLRNLVQHHDWTEYPYQKFNTIDTIVRSFKNF